MGLGSYLKSLATTEWGKFTVFAQHAEVSAQVEVAKAKILALDELNKLGKETLAFLEQEKIRVSSDAAVLKDRIDALLSKI